MDFCRKNGLPVSGGKLEISDRIAYFLETGKVMPAKVVKKSATKRSDITEDTKIEAATPTERIAYYTLRA